MPFCTLKSPSGSLERQTIGRVCLSSISRVQALISLCSMPSAYTTARTVVDLFIVMGPEYLLELRSGSLPSVV